MRSQDKYELIRQGTDSWNKWREKNPEADVILSEAKLSGAKLSGAKLSGANLSEAKLIGVNLSAADLSKANLSWAEVMVAALSGVDLTGADLTGADLTGADLTGADLTGADLDRADLSGANLSGANLSGANLSGANLNRANLSGAVLNAANLTRTQALETIFTEAELTGAHIEDWNINRATKLNKVICDYVYLKPDQKERRPHNGNFAPGEFTKLFQKALETIDLIFRERVDWDAIAYSFKKVEVENKDAEIDVYSIEKRGDGVLVVRLSVSSDSDKTKIYQDLTRFYELAHKTLEAQYQGLLEEQDKPINQLLNLVYQSNNKFSNC